MTISMTTAKTPPVLTEWAQDLERRVDVHLLGFPVLAFDCVDSTSTLLKTLALDGAPEGLTVVAREQTGGRGRLGRRWHSPRDRGVYLSLLLKPPVHGEDAKWLAVLVGLAVARALSGLGVRDISVKWPNDILAGGRKIAGILVEPRMGRERIHFAVVGVGVNVEQAPDDWPDDLRRTATSCRAAGAAVSRDQVIAALLWHLDNLYIRLKREGVSFLAAAWREWEGSLPG